MSDDLRTLATLASLVAAVGLAAGAFVGREDFSRFENEAIRVEAEVLSSPDLPSTFEEGRLEIPFERPPAGRSLYVRLDLGEERDQRLMVNASLDGGANEFVVHRGPADGEFALVSPRLPEGSEPRIWIEIRRLSGSIGPAGAVQEVEVLAGDVPALPRLPDLLLPAVLASLAFLLVWLETGSAAPSASSGVTAAALSALALHGAPDLAADFLPLLVAGLSLVALPLAMRRSERCGAAIAAALVGIAWWALRLRWQVLGQMVFDEIEPDTIDYLSLARGLDWIYDTGTREPFFVWVLKAASWFLGPGHATPRLVSVGFSVVSILLTYRLAARLFDRPVGVLAALSSAVAGFLVDQSVRGLRFELYVVEILLLLELVLLERDSRTWKTDLAAGVLGGVILLTRLASLGFVAIALGAIFLRRGKKSPRALALLVLPPLLLVAPHLHHNRAEHGDVLDSVNRHVRYYRNREFAGTPGYPSLAEVEKDPYGGVPVTTFDYLFRLHEPRQLWASSIEGYQRLLVGGFSKKTYFGGAEYRQILCLAGLFLFLFHGRGRIVLVSILLLLGPLPFLLGAAREFDPRLVYHVAPFLEMAAAWAALFPLRALAPAALHTPP